MLAKLQTAKLASYCSACFNRFGSRMIEITPASPNEYPDICCMINELLEEIIEKWGEGANEFDESAALHSLEEGIANNKLWIFVAKDGQKLVGMISLVESFALYAGGTYGTITELYIREPHRSQKIGKLLIDQVVEFAKQKKWQRLEVTTPPLPAFDRSLNFYRKYDFEISGGCKLKLPV